MRGDVEVRLRPQALKAFAVLATHRGEHVGHDRMIAEAWGGNVVSRHTVDVTIGEVRRTLGECGSWIAQRPKVGYLPRRAALRRADQTRSSCSATCARGRGWRKRSTASRRRPPTIRPTSARSRGSRSVTWRLGTQGMRAPRETYDRFLSAQRRAEALGGLTPQLRCDRGLRVAPVRAPAVRRGRRARPGGGR